MVRRVSIDIPAMPSGELEFGSVFSKLVIFNDLYDTSSFVRFASSDQFLIYRGHSPLIIKVVQFLTNFSTGLAH